MAAGDLLLLERWGPGTFGVQNLDPPAALDPNTPCVNIGSPPLWGANCLRVDHSAGMRSFYDYDITADNVSKVLVHEFLFTSESLADGQLANVFSTKEQATIISRFQLQQTAGVLQFVLLVSHNGSPNVIATPTLVIPTIYRCELLWDIAGAAWGVWVNGVSQGSGAITGTGLDLQLDNIQPGGIDLDGAAATHFGGPVLAYVGPRIENKWRNTLGRHGPVRRRRFAGGTI